MCLITIVKNLLFLLGIFFAVEASALTASFNATVSSGCVPLVVDFTDATTGGIPISWDYDFGDGGSSTAQNPRYTFTKAGTFKVELTVYDGSVYSKYSVFIIVRKNPAANFSSNKSAYCPGEVVQFTNTTVPGDTTVKTTAWDFGDGNVVNSNSNVTKSYLNSGNYTVKMTVRDNFNCASTISKNQFITVNPKPTPTFSYVAKYSCVAPQKVNFSNNSGNSVSYVWDFGDGNTTTNAAPVIFYDVPKTYTVKLTATSDKGCVASSVTNIVVNFGKIKADFTTSAPAGCIPFDPKFKNASLPTGAKFDYLWDFGDGTKSTAENPSKIISKTGNYQVKFRIKGDGAGCADSITKTILVSDKPKATLKIKDTLKCDGEMINVFKAESTSQIAKYTWFIDGKNIDTKVDTLQYEFKKTGEYKVVVLLQDIAGCQQTFQYPRIVLQHLFAGFFMNAPGGCVPYKPIIIDTTDSKIPSTYDYTWYDDNGKTYKTQIPNVIYNKEDTFELKLKIKDKYGCEDEAWNYVFVGHKVKPSFSINKYSICNNEDITMTNTTPDSLRKQVHRWMWEFGIAKGDKEDRFIANIRDYPQKYSPLLITVNNECRDTCIKEDSITIKPVLADFVYSFDTCFSNTGKLRHSSVLATDFTWVLPGGIISKDSVIYYKFKSFVKDKFYIYASNKLTGCFDTLMQEISPPVSTSNILETKITSCTPQIYKFENFQTRAYRLHWDFGNGDTSAQSDSLRYSFHLPGKYVVKLTGWDIRSCPYTSQKTILVDGPTAGGKIWPERGCLPLKIQLIDSFSYGKIKRKYWKFEDDAQWLKASNKFDTINYTINNMPMSGDSFFHIELFVEDSNGCKSTRIFKLRPSGPRAGVQLTSESRCDAKEFSYNASLDSASAVYPVSMKWTLGDGTFRTIDKFKYIYSKGGKYNVKLEIVDGLGCKFEEGFSLNTTDPEILAKISTDLTSAVCPPLQSNFRSVSLSDPNNPIVSYLWDFGDGSYSTLMNPSKLYTLPGNFDISLTVKNAFGCSNKVTMPAYIHLGGPTAIYKYSPLIACQNLKVNFSAQTSPNTTIEWDFGNGHTSKNLKPSYQYDRQGLFFPKILLKDSGGCTTVIIPKDSILIYPVPSARFAISSNCLDDSIRFSNLSLSNVKSNLNFQSKWLVDTFKYNNQNLSIKFGKTAQYPVQLVVINQFSCSDTSKRSLPIVKPKAGFKLGSDRICLGDSLAIQNTSSSNQGIQNVAYYLGNNGPLQLPLYPGKGDYQLKQIITDTFNCTDTIKHIKSIHTADTAPPTLINIRHVSHLSNNELECLISPSVDADFDHYSYYQLVGTDWQLIRTIKKRDSAFIKLLLNPLKTSQKFAVRQSNYCLSESGLSTEHANIHLTTEGKLNHNHLKWNPYIGWTPDYYAVERENSDGSFAEIGRSSLPEYIDSMILCKQTHAYRIKAISTNEYSYSDSSRALAQWENKLPDILIDLVSVSNDTGIEVHWNYPSNYNRTLLQEVIVYKNALSESDQFSFSKDSIQFYDRAVNVDLKNYHYQLRVRDHCGDTSKFNLSSGNILLRSDQTIPETAPKLVWNHYKHWSAGIAYYELERMNASGEFELLSRLNDTTYTDEGTQNSCMKQYIYRVIAVSSDRALRSYSNTIKVKPMSLVFIPNAFTPNSNQLNEVFVPVGQYLYNYHLELFNQWGEKLFETEDCMQAWDGTYNGEKCPQGVYFYKFTARGADGKYYNRKGTINLLK